MRLIFLKDIAREINDNKYLDDQFQVIVDLNSKIVWPKDSKFDMENKGRYILQDVEVKILAGKVKKLRMVVFNDSIIFLVPYNKKYIDPQVMVMGKIKMVSLENEFISLSDGGESIYVGFNSMDQKEVVLRQLKRQIDTESKLMERKLDLRRATIDVVRDEKVKIGVTSTPSAVF